LLQENAPFSDFGNETPALMGANLMISVVDVIGDLLLLYRCWLVWEKNFYVIVLPLLTALGGFGELPSIFSLDGSAHLHPLCARVHLTHTISFIVNRPDIANSSG
jgi:hypothetical protein